MKCAPKTPNQAHMLGDPVQLGMFPEHHLQDTAADPANEYRQQQAARPQAGQQKLKEQP